MPITLTLLEEKKMTEYFDNSEYTGDKLYPKLDLTSNQWVIDYDKVIVDATILIESSTEMRIDTVARYLLGTENYVDVIVKFNKISNPYGIKTGDIIVIPNLASFFANIKRINYKSKNIINSTSNSTSNGTSTENLGNASVAVRTSGKGSKTYRKGENGVIVF